MIKKDPGVYMIKNKGNNKVYIGSSNNLYKRHINHFSSLKKNKHENHYLQSDWNENEKIFDFIVLEYVKNKALLLEKEKYWMDKFESYKREKGYNIFQISDDLKTIFPEETRKKISEVNKQLAEITARKGDDHGNSKLTESIILDLINDYNNGESVKDLADIYKITITVIYKIINGEAWKHMDLKNINKRNDSHKLNIDDVQFIKMELYKGTSIKDLAKHFNVDRSTIEYIKWGKNWGWVLPELDLRNIPKSLPNKRKKLDIDKVREIKIMLKRGDDIKAIAEIMDVATRTIYGIKNEEYWKDVRV